MRKLRVRKYESKEEIARDLQAASRILTKSRMMIEECRANSAAPLSKRQEMVSRKFPKIISAVATLDAVIPNMSNWIMGTPEQDVCEATTKTIEQLALKHEKAKTKFLSTARVMAGQTSKRFRALSNQVKARVDNALYGTYKQSKINLMLLPVSEGETVTAALLSYSDMRDQSGYVYPNFYAYLFETASGVEVRSSPFFSLSYLKGEPVKSAADASRLVLARLTMLDITPGENNV